MLADRVKDFLHSYSLLKKGERVLVAYSGGPDSTCLLVLLSQLWKQTAAVYVNHQFRGDESKREEEFVRRFCGERNIPLYVERISWNKRPGNLEEAARKRRYRHLAKVAAEHGYHKVALAHQKDDIVENFLLRLLRGAGPQGLAAMQPQRDIYIRPLLECSRTDILHYLSQNRIPYFSDTSNLEPIFARNRIRNELIPFVEKHFASTFSKSVHRSALWIREQNDLFSELLKPYEKLIERKDDRIVLPKKRFLRLSLPLRKALLRLLVQQVDPARHLSSRFLKRLLEAIQHEENLELPGFLMVQSEPNFIAFTQKTHRVGYFEMDVPKEGSYFFPPGSATLTFSKSQGIHFGAAKDTAFLDMEKASFPLYVRNWKKGDLFRPLGMTGRKKLSDFWIDRKVARERRKKIPLVFKDEDLVWIAGHEIAHDYRITEATRKVLRIELKNKDV